MKANSARCKAAVGFLTILLAPPAGAAVVGTGSLMFTVDTSTSTFTGTVVFDDVTNDLLGTPVDLGTGVGTANVLGSYVFNNPDGTFAETVISSPAGAFLGSAAGSFICPAGNCFGPPVSYIATFTELSGTVPAGFPPGLTYSLDGTVTYVPPTVGTIFHDIGTVAINAFAPQPTPTSPSGCSGAACQVVVNPPPTDVYNSATGQHVAVSATITFPDVTGAGTTTVTGVSNVAAQLTSNFAFSSTATFIDVSTTATVDTSGGPIGLCVDYDIAGTVTDPTQLRLLHADGGIWVDVTTSVDTATHTICGQVSHLSPFGVATLTPCPVTLQPACTGAQPHDAKLTIANPGAGKGSLGWQWKHGAVTEGDLGDPAQGTDYELCLYDQTPAHALVLSVPAGRTCGTKPCWQATGTGFKYSNNAGSPAGVVSAKLRAGATPKGSLAVKAKGGNLQLPGMPLTPPVTVQLRNGAGSCWQGAFSTPVKNDAMHFSAISD
jgi:hypothetical protein